MKKQIEELKETRRCIAVDFDGTIVGSEDLFWGILAKKLKDEYAIDFTAEHKERYLGNSNQQIERMVCEDFNGTILKPGFYQEIKHEYMENVRVNGVERNEQLIDYLKDADCDTYIVTNNIEVAVKEILKLEGLSDLFKLVISPPDMGVVKKDVLRDLVCVYGVKNVEFHDDLPFNVEVGESLGIKTYKVENVVWGESKIISKEESKK